VQDGEYVYNDEYFRRAIFTVNMSIYNRLVLDSCKPKAFVIYMPPKYLTEWQSCPRGFTFFNVSPSPVFVQIHRNIRMIYILP